MQKDFESFTYEEFESMLSDLIGQDVNVPDERDDEAPIELPFPSEMSDRVADAMMKNGSSNHGKTQDQEDVITIEVQVLAQGENACFTDAPVRVTFKSKKGTYLRQHRFACYVYTEDFFPMCDSKGEVAMKRPKKGRLEMEITCDHLWLPGKYFLLMEDTQDGKLKRIDFTLNEQLATTFSMPNDCSCGSMEDVLVSCIHNTDDGWKAFCEKPGTVQFRRKLIEARQLLLYNEFRKEIQREEIASCSHLQIATLDDDFCYNGLLQFQYMMQVDYQFCVIDGATAYNPMQNNPYEDFAEKLDNLDMKVLCLIHLGDLLTATGKLIMRRIIDKVKRAGGRTLLWLCGSQREIDHLMEMYPSLKTIFLKNSLIAQEPYSAFELAQAFFRQLMKEDMVPTQAVKNRLVRTILDNHRQGTLVDWSMEGIRRFIAEEVRPRYLQRAIPMLMTEAAPELIEADFPFEMLANSTSAFDESIAELNEMIGLEEVKRGVMTMANRARLCQERRKRGLKVGDGAVYHSIFTGNPGTGKTTVARQLGQIYHALGLLSKGEVIAVDRTRLVGQFIGQTEENMKAVLEEAKGNVLFIDEAYTLSAGTDDKKDFGGRVLDSLLTVLTQPDPDMLIVFAGYTKEMDAMLNSNPGLAGRFPYRYQFADYSGEELLEIARRLLERQEYTLSAEADETLQQVVNQVLSQKQPNFSNARWVEQFICNGIIPAMANRVFSTACQDFQRIEAEDVLQGFEKFKPETVKTTERHRITGFKVA